MYLLPPTLFPNEPLDNMDERYLNANHAPMVSPLHHPLKIELDNDVYFPPSSRKLQPKIVDTPTCVVDSTPTEPYDSVTSMPRADRLFEESGYELSAIECADRMDALVVPRTLDLSNQLFFVQYTPADTMRRSWYLIQVDMPSTLEMNPNYATNGEYWCVFHFKHPSDIKLSNTNSRGWPEWYHYQLDPVSDDIIYGDRILIRPSVTPCAQKFIQWATLIPLLGTKSFALVGPFTFAPLDDYNRTRQSVASVHWQALVLSCSALGILPPQEPYVKHDNPKVGAQKRKRN